MGEFLSRRSRHNNMQAFVLTSLLAAAFAAPSAEPKPDAYGFYGHHVYHGPPCKHAFVEETKEVCHIEPEKVCETKTRTYKEFEICHLEPKKVCEEKTFKVPTLDCETEEKEE